MVDERRSSLVPELGTETRVGDKPVTRAANDVLLALSRAARSFTLFAPENETVRRLIGAYRDKTQETLALHGALSFEVHPFELRFQGAVVYKEMDRNRSLAFRLFRDGVRSLTLRPEVPWEELLKLLEVFSIRYTGVRQQEDDMVTLLRKAEFTGIDIHAVEGFVPDEEDPESEEVAQVRDRTEHVVPPPDWDQPLPSFAATRDLRYRPIPPDYAAQLCSEEGLESLDRSAMMAAQEVLFLTAQGHVDVADAIAFVEEVSEFLLVEGRCGPVRSLLADLGAALPLEPAAAESLKKLTPKKIIERYVRAPRQDEGSMRSLLALVDGDPLGALLELLGDEHDDERRAMLRNLLTSFAGSDPEAIQAHLADAPPTAAAALFEILRRVAPERAVEAAYTMLDHPAEDVQLSVLRVFAQAPLTARLGLALRSTLSNPSEAVRIGAVQVLAKRRGAQAFATLREHAKARADANMSREEAIAIGRTLAFSDPVAARPLFHEWTHIKGLRRLLASLAPPSIGQRMLRFAAVAGIHFGGGREAAAQIEEVAAQSYDAELAAYCRELNAQGGSVKPDG